MLQGWEPFCGECICGCVFFFSFFVVSAFGVACLYCCVSPGRQLEFVNPGSQGQAAVSPVFTVFTVFTGLVSIVTYFNFFC